MKIVSEVYSESGKASVNLGQAIIIAAVVSQLFTQQPIGWGIALIGLAVGLISITIGLILIQKAHHVKKFEESDHG
ncbi:MAG: hypothetical protein ONB44_03670 [candidate division KSB1 bacterium]|nr:hypothetical protein [candidate division KSB1 bacterium]MDZ7301227.1 hypothetical protein [candidate division KSB1 bacterium]MDZ7310549.1 hypothetical protein [candidate division KSB1 bacterium]